MASRSPASCGAATRERPSCRWSSIRRIAGRTIPTISRSTCPLLDLRRAEDTYVDELYAAAPALGATLIGAVFPRSYLDLNRAADDLDPALIDGRLPPRR